MARRIQIDPMTRLEGHGRIEIFLDDEGDVANAYFQVPELRGFERFCVGRPAEEMPVITNRICGICPEAHHLAATKALDELFGVTPPRAAVLLRELIYCAFFIADHATHFYALGGPDFLIGPDAPPEERNLLGVIHKLGLAIGREVLACRARNHEVIHWLGGRAVHPAAGLPGGWSTALSEERRREVEGFARKNIEFAQFSLRLFDQLVLGNPASRETIFGDTYLHRTYSVGTVDAQNRSNFYDGHLRVVDPEGKELVRFNARDYGEQIAERVESWTYLKFPYLKAVGWKGFTEGAESGVYISSPLSRLNVSDSLATPLANEAYEQFYEAFGSRRIDGRYQPVHHRLATHWARLIELLSASERMLELALDPEVTNPDVRRAVQTRAGRGVGSVEAPRGTLIHDYTADERGVLTKVNMIVGTTHNHTAMAMSIKKAASALIRKGTVIEQGLLNRIEMAFRLYDPCLSCATHALPGQMALVVSVRAADGSLLRTIARKGAA